MTIRTTHDDSIDCRWIEWYLSDYLGTSVKLSIAYTWWQSISNCEPFTPCWLVPCSPVKYHDSIGRPADQDSHVHKVVRECNLWHKWFLRLRLIAYCRCIERSKKRFLPLSFTRFIVWWPIDWAYCFLFFSAKNFDAFSVTCKLELSIHTNIIDVDIQFIWIQVTWFSYSKYWLLIIMIDSGSHGSYLIGIMLLLYNMNTIVFDVPNCHLSANWTCH